MKWGHPPIIKIYEALGAIADGRIEVSENSARVYSSSGNKFYTVTHDPAANAIMVNDNGSFYKGYLGYPAIAYLMVRGELAYVQSIAEKLRNIAWKDINQKFKNDFDKTLEYILKDKTPEEKLEIGEEVKRINDLLKDKHLDLLGPKISPPEGY